MTRPQSLKQPQSSKQPQSVKRPLKKLLAAGALVAAAALALTACSPGTTAESASASITTVTPGKLTIATGDPAYSPWVEDNKPQSGKGFEAAVAYAVADKLGFKKADVVWKRTTFDSAIAPGAKNWDFNLQQFSITSKRAKAVDFSSPYYVTNQAVLTTKNSPVAKATSIADLRSYQFGVQVGTTSLQTVQNTIKPTKSARIYNNSQDVVQALKNGQVQAIVVDLPTAFYLASAELDNGVVSGQFEDATGGDSYGLVLPKGSSLTKPVTKAVDELRADGTLKKLQTQWLSSATKVPVLH